MKKIHTKIIVTILVLAIIGGTVWLLDSHGFGFGEICMVLFGVLAIMLN